MLGLLAASGVVVAALNAWLTVPDALRGSLESAAVPGGDVGSTGWAWIGSASAGLGLAAWLAAAWFVSHWPEMGRRYDAPRPEALDKSELDLWKVLDEGRDPTS